MKKLLIISAVMVCSTLTLSLMITLARASNPEARCSAQDVQLQASNLEPVAQVSGTVRALAVEGNYVYTVDWNDGLHIINVSDPSNPIETGTLNQTAYDITVVGNYAYLAQPSGGLSIIDIADPENPIKVGNILTKAFGVDVVGSYAYVTTGPYDGPLYVVDISNPANPSEKGACSIAGSTVGLKVVGDFAYVANAYGGLHIVDISNPTFPIEVGTYDIWGESYNVAVAGGYAYLAAGCSGRGMHIIDITMPHSPTSAGYFYTFAYVRDVVVVGDYAYLANAQDGLRIVDISNPRNPVEVAHYDTEGSARGVAVAGNYVYVADVSGGLVILRYLQSPYSSIAGRVLNDNGIPIENVQIMVGTQYSATTNANGQYTITDVLPGTYTLVPTEAGYFWSPTARTVTVPPDAADQDFTTQNIQKAVTSGPYAANYNDPLTYTVRLVFPEHRDLVMYDQVPTYTTYISGSLDAPMDVAYDPVANAISGTLSMIATEPLTVSFVVRVGITGTLGFAPPIVNRACFYPFGAPLDDCVWSNEVRSPTYIWPVYLPLVIR